MNENMSQTPFDEMAWFENAGRLISEAGCTDSPFEGTEPSSWMERSSPPPENCSDFYWVRLQSGEIVMGYWSFNRFDTADSAGDREGLHVEHIEDWTHWHEIEPPKWSK